MRKLGTSNKYYLSTLPTFLDYDIKGVKIKFTHGSPNAINEYLYEDKENTEEVMKKPGGRYSCLRSYPHTFL